ncbi:hypothetical protein HPTD01_581 [Halomonas sp. TD01]|nr:hypothetical protein HPTD01_581 [Halomonas sp. TD01]
MVGFKRSGLGVDLMIAQNRRLTDLKNIGSKIAGYLKP